MTGFRVQIDPFWPWPILVIVLAVAGLSVWGGYRLARGLSPGRRRWLLGVRLATLLVLLIAALRPQLQWISPEGEQPHLWILADSSRSMTVQDGTGNTSRRQGLLSLLDSVQTELGRLGEEVQIEQFDFDEQLLARQQFSLNAEGGQTALGHVLDEASRYRAQHPLAAILLLTDGAQRAVAPLDQDPRDVARELGEQGISLYPVPIGQVGSTLASADAAIAEIQVDPVVFEKKRVPVSVNVRWTGAPGQKLKVQLLLEDRSGLRFDESGPLRPIPPQSGVQTEVEIETRYPDGNQTVEMSFTPELAGEYKLAAAVAPLAGEVQTRNNTRETLLTVRKGGLRVAYFDVFRTEVKSVRQLNASENVQIDFQLIRPGRLGGASQIDPNWFDAGRYDVYIIGDVSAEQLGNASLALLAERVREGAGLMMLGGYHTYSAGGYAGTPLERLLPVALNPAEKRNPETFDQSQQIRGELTLQPTANGNRHFVTRIAAGNDNVAAWRELPPLTGATRIQAKSDFVEVLATSPTGDHLIVAAETGPSRVLCLAFDETYLWSQAGFEDQHRRFWRQSILWLAHKELDTDQPVWLTLTPKAADPGARIQLDYGARDEQNQPLKDVRFTVEVKLPDGSTQNVSGEPTAEGQSAKFTKTDLPGDYFVRVEGRQQENSPGPPALSRFLIHDRDLELDYPIVDRGLLDEMARQAGLATDSRLINPEELQEFLRDLLKRKPWRNNQEIAATWNMWDGWPILLLFAGLMTVEWVLRKQGGLV